MKVLLLALLLFASTTTHAQFAQWDWVKYGQGSRAGAPGAPTGTAVCTDAAHNVYVLGIYIDSLQLDTMQFTSTENLFLAKYDAAGNLLWVKNPTGNGTSYGSAINVDEAGDIYIGGYFSDTVNFNGITLASRGIATDIFLAKYDASGNIIWAKRAGGPGNDLLGYSYAYNANGGMTLDNKGGIYITASIGPGVADFDTIQITSTTSLSGLIAKYDTSGSIVWLKQFGLNAQTFSCSIALDKTGDLFITGTFSRANYIYFDSIKLSSAASYLHNYMFIAKYDNYGNALWAKGVGSNNARLAGYTSGLSLTTDRSENVIVTGNAYNDTTFFDSIALPSRYTADNGFIAKYNPSGNIMWARNMNESLLADNYPNYISIDTNDNLYITGNFSGNCSFGNKTITSNGNYDIYVAQYNDNGDLQWLTSFGGTQYDACLGITTDNTGAVYVTGNVEDTCAFGPYTISGNNSNMFVAKLGLPPAGLQQVAKPAVTISVYPNPAGNTTTISANSGNITSLHMIDCLGRTVYAQTSFAQKNTILNTAAFAAGVYFITCETDLGSRINDKLVIQH
ncbi:MAG: T9SS type A sorting domain-containing protein [Flavipsychrobacter sp.]|nr:T9SS type A sorting domain-containing protein [Flavipsychrobacter sp.]